MCSLGYSRIYHKRSKGRVNSKPSGCNTVKEEINNTNHEARVEHILFESAARWPTHSAVIDPTGSCTFEQLAKQASEIARTLQRVEVKPGSVVGISATQAQNFLAILFGTLLADCVAIPVAPHIPEAEQARLVRETGVEWLFEETVAGAEREQPLANGPHFPGGECVTLAVFDGVHLQLTRQNSPATSTVTKVFPDAAVIRHTSGTTARSKGVVLSHTAVRERVEASRELIDLRHNDVVLTPLSLSYHFIASALSCIKAGATILDCTQAIAPEMLALGARWGATIIYASPIQYELMSRTNDAQSLPTLRRAISTSALLPKRTAEAFLERFGVRLTQVYGIIEVGLPLWNDLESIESTALGICKGPYEAEVLDAEGHAVGMGEIGELAIRGPGLFSGYLMGGRGGCMPRQSETFVRNDQWFLTGDLVLRDELGVILYRGRKKSIINCGGNKIFPEEIEEVLRQSPEVVSVRVSAEPHPLLGSVVIAEIVVDASKQPSVESWRELCSKELSSYKIPKEFRVVESLPCTGSGKIVRYTAQQATSDF